MLICVAGTSDLWASASVLSHNVIYSSGRFSIRIRSNRSGSIGFERYPLKPASRYICFASESAFAVMAIAGICLYFPPSIPFIFWSMISPSISGIIWSIKNNWYSCFLIMASPCFALVVISICIPVLLASPSMILRFTSLSSTTRTCALSAWNISWYAISVWIFFLYLSL